MSFTKIEEVTYANEGGTEDERFWDQYLKEVIDEDTRLIDRWQKMLDTLLVYVGLFLAVLTAFIVQVWSLVQPSPTDATNNILIAVYNHTTNASSPIDLERYLTWDKAFDSNVSESIHLLYVSLAVSVTQAAAALIINIWLTRYLRSLSETAPTIHDRIRKWNESHTGLMEWRIPVVIEILSSATVVVLLLFAVFISVGWTLDRIFIAAALIFLLVSSFAAFIPGAPFHSPFSSLILFIFHIIPNLSIYGPITTCNIFATLVCACSLFAFFTSYFSWLTCILIVFLVPPSLLSFCYRTQAELKVQKQPKPRIFSLPTWLYFHCFIILTLFLSAMYTSYQILKIVLYSLTGVVCIIMTKGAIRMSQWAPDEAKAKVDAVAWMMKTHHRHHSSASSDNSVVLQNAIQVAQKFPHSRSALLKDILRTLNALILQSNIQRIKEPDLEDGGEHENKEKTCVSLLAVLVDFEESRAVYWRNEAAVELPDLSEGLKGKLHELRGDGCTVIDHLTHHPPALQSESVVSRPPLGCTKCEAEFILCKVGESGMVERQFLPRRVLDEEKGDV